MLPQFTRRARYRLNSVDFSIGTTIFFMGLFKKVVLADHLATIANPVFDGALTGHQAETAGKVGGAASFPVRHPAVRLGWLKTTPEIHCGQPFEPGCFVLPDQPATWTSSLYPWRVSGDVCWTLKAGRCRTCACI